MIVGIEKFLVVGGRSTATVPVYRRYYAFSYIESTQHTKCSKVNDKLNCVLSTLSVVWQTTS